MTTIMEFSFLDLFSNKIKQDIHKWYSINNLSERLDHKKINELTIDEWLTLWKDGMGGKIYGDSIISLNNQIKIMKTLYFHMEIFIQLRCQVLENFEKQNFYMDNKSKNELFEQMAWNSLNTTDSDLGYRLQMGMRNIGCSYRREDKWYRGCYMCGYYAGIAFGVKPTTIQLIRQFENTIKEIEEKKSSNYDVIEFVSDGSFLNDEEVYPEVRIQIFKQIAEKKAIKRIMIETRPEFLTENKLTQLLNIIRPDQKLEIGMGLESYDNFIRDILIHKGYGKEEFESAIRLIQKNKLKCSALAYALIKPPFLSEKEAIQDSIRTGEYIKEINERFCLDVMIKYEPAVVAEGTLLDILYEEKRGEMKRNYHPPSYWTVVEIIARMDKKNLTHLIRIGAREDMDKYKAIAATYYDIGMLSRFDFIIYDAVQKFNQHKNIVKFLLALEPAFKDRSYEEWKNENDIEYPVIFELYLKYKKSIENLKTASSYKRRNKILKDLFEILDEIEYGRKTQDLAKKIDENNVHTYNENNEIIKYITNIFKNNISNIYISIANIELLYDGLKLLRMELNIYSQELNENFNIWIGIPTIRYIRLDEVE